MNNSNSKIVIKEIYKETSCRVLYEELESGEKMEWHRHSDTDDVFYVLEGFVTIMEKNPTREHTISKGEIYVVSKNTIHRSINKCNDRARWILIQGVGDVHFESLKAQFGD